MKQGALTHQPVMVAEVLEGLAIRPDGRYIDGTFGRGGHTKAILAQLGPEGRLLAVDCDLAAITAGRADPDLQDERFVLRHGNFDQLAAFADELGWVGEVDGILLDVGVSSPQLDDPGRGFSFRETGPLDMRMDTSTVEMDAATWLNSASEDEIAHILATYGDERYRGRIARAIVEARPLETTGELADIIERVVPRRERRKHPATRSFQAIRIFINDEMGRLEHGLTQSITLLRLGGRLVVITFHSLEGRLVKRFVSAQTPQDLPRLKRIGRAVKVSRSEAVANPRARSAVVRVAEKVA